MHQFLLWIGVLSMNPLIPINTIKKKNYLRAVEFKGRFYDSF